MLKYYTKEIISCIQISHHQYFLSFFEYIFYPTEKKLGIVDNLFDKLNIVDLSSYLFLNCVN